MKRRFFVTMCVSLLTAMAFVVSTAAVSEARDANKKKPAKHSLRKSRHRPVKSLKGPKKMSAEKRRQHDALVAKLKEQEQQEKMKAAAAQGSLQAAILKTAPAKEPNRENSNRSAASAPSQIEKSTPPLQETAAARQQGSDYGVNDVELDLKSVNDTLPSASEADLDSNGEF